MLTAAWLYGCKQPTRSFSQHQLYNHARYSCQHQPPSCHHAPASISLLLSMQVYNQPFYSAGPDEAVARLANRPEGLTHGAAHKSDALGKIQCHPHMLMYVDGIAGKDLLCPCQLQMARIARGI